MNILSNMVAYIKHIVRPTAKVQSVGKGKAAHLVLGKKGEKIALKFLRKNGYRHLRSNYVGNREEIDLIMQEGKVLVFIEVKTRRNEDFAPGESAVNNRKRKHISAAASEFIRKYNLRDKPCRFDVIIVIMHDEGKPTVRHHENAFQYRQ